MGGFTSAIAPLAGLLSGGTSVISLATQAFKSSQSSNDAKKQNQLEEQQLAERNRLNAEERQTKSLNDEQQRLKNLNRSLATQKAQFASQGLSVTDDNSSVDTVLDSIIDDSESEARNREQIDSLKTRAEELNLAQKQRRNLLDERRSSNRQILSGVTGLLA
jgi:hypothetical protein